MHPFRCTFRLQFRNERMEKPFFGPGVATLLRLTEETGSLHTAAKEMGMAYSKAWKILKNAEEALDVKLLERRSGGAGGGFSRLTEEGRSILKRFEILEKALRETRDQKFRELFPDWEEDRQ